MRRLVNDYPQPPKVTKKMDIGLQRLMAMEEDIQYLIARDPHELLRANEAQHIYDCAKMGAIASMYRTESRWGLYHYYVDYPETNDDDWFCHVQLYKNDEGEMVCKTRLLIPMSLNWTNREKCLSTNARSAS